MRIRSLLLIAFPLCAFAQPPVPAVKPTINPDGIVRADTTRPGILSPGIVFSIWGHGYGPHAGCKGPANNAPATEACGVRVLLDDVPIEVQYTNDVLINARMPESTASRPVSQLVVLSGGLRSNPTEVRRLPEVAVIALDGIARVDGPAWIHVQLPRSQKASYPSMIHPWDFGCDEFEVRRNGKAIAPIAHSMPGMGIFQKSCPWVVDSAGAHTDNRLPLHLQFAFTEPGKYEIRLSHYDDFGLRKGDARVQSAWTEITVLPVAPRAVTRHPQGPAELLSDFLPNLLARRDDEALGVLLEYLYHASPRVRRYVADALYYWPDSVVDARLLETVRASGPSPDIVQRLSGHLAELVDAAMPYFLSDDLVLFQGAVASARVVLIPSGGSDPQLRSRVGERLIAAASGNLGHADAQTTNDVIVLLSQIHTDQVHDLLWGFAEHHTNVEQALICIAWQKDPKDLARMTDFLIAQPADDKSGVLTGVAYAMHNQFGEAALPWLRTILEKSQIKFLRTAAAEQLMRGNDKAGFAFALDAVDNDRAWKREILRMLNDQFPGTRSYADVQLSAFLSARAQ